MRIMVVGDIHLNEWQEFAKYKCVKGYCWNSRLYEQIEVLKQILDYIKTHKPHMVVILGDVFHRYLPDTQKVFYSFLSKISAPEVVVLVGNHDLVDESKRKHKIVLHAGSVVNEPKVLEKNGIRYGFVPFYRDVEFVDFTIKNMQADVVFAHVDIMGFYYSEFGVSPDDLRRFKLFVNGHYHNPQRIGNILLAGAVMDFSFSDVGHNQKGVWLIEDTEIVKFLPLKYKRFIAVSEEELQNVDTDKYYVKVLVKEAPKQVKENVRYQFSTPAKELSDLPSFPELLEKYANMYENPQLAKEFISSVGKIQFDLSLKMNEKQENDISYEDLF